MSQSITFSLRPAPASLPRLGGCARRRSILHPFAFVVGSLGSAVQLSCRWVVGNVPCFARHESTYCAPYVCEVPPGTVNVCTLATKAGATPSPGGGTRRESFSALSPTPYSSFHARSSGGVVHVHRPTTHGKASICRGRDGRICEIPSAVLSSRARVRCLPLYCRCRTSLAITVGRIQNLECD